MTIPRSSSWNAAARVGLRTGGQFSSRMEAKDGSMGFDFAGVYTQVVPHGPIALVADAERNRIGLHSMR